MFIILNSIVELLAPPSHNGHLVETREHLQPGLRLLLGGIFETGGFMNAYIRQDHRNGYVYNYVRPIASLSDTNQTSMERLHDIFGGTINAIDNSWRWLIRDDDAIRVVSMMEDCAPSRQPCVKAFQQLAQTSDIQEKIIIVNGLRRYGKKNRFPVVPEVYSDLIMQPEFLTGVLIAHGSPEELSNRTPESTRAGLAIYSTNTALLLSLHQLLGGSWENRVKENKINGDPRRYQSNCLRLGSQITSKLMKFVKPFCDANGITL